MHPNETFPDCAWYLIGSAVPKILGQVSAHLSRTLPNIQRLPSAVMDFEVPSRVCKAPQTHLAMDTPEKHSYMCSAP